MCMPRYCSRRRAHPPLYAGMNVFMYVYMFVCTYVRVCTFTCVYDTIMFAAMFAARSSPTPIRKYVRMCVCMYVRMYVCVYICVCVWHDNVRGEKLTHHLHADMYVYACVYLCMYLYKSVCRERERACTCERESQCGGTMPYFRCHTFSPEQFSNVFIHFNV